MRRNVIFFCIWKIAGVVLCKKQGCSIKLCSTVWCNWCLRRNGFENVGVARVTSKDAVLFPKHSLRYMRCCCCLHSNSAAECVPLCLSLLSSFTKWLGHLMQGLDRDFSDGSALFARILLLGRSLCTAEFLSIFPDLTVECRNCN